MILLCFLTNTYPFFLSNDEADALIELSHVYGTDKMQECAKANSKCGLWTVGIVWDINVYVSRSSFRNQHQSSQNQATVAAFD